MKLVVAIAGLVLPVLLPGPAFADDFLKQGYELTRPRQSPPTYLPPPQGRNIPAKGASIRARPTPPQNGRYVPREGAASRGCGSGKMVQPLVPSQQTNDDKAIIPKLSTGGFTAKTHPHFWFQVPFRTAEIEELEFTLQDEDDQDIYRARLAVEPNSALVQVMLPANQPGLAIEQRYRWILKARLDCGPDRSPTGTQFVKGWIQRYELEASLVDQLAAATPLQQAQLYADAGVWFDALNILAPLQSAKLRDTASQNAWQDLLKRYAIELQPSEL